MAQAKILVVDDEPNIRFFLERVLTRDGYEVTAVASGEEALALMADQDFDLAMLDLKLKHINGMQVLRQLRQDFPNLAVIILTGYATLDTAVEALRHGAHDYLFKPAKTMQVRESVRSALVKRRRELRQQKLLSSLEQNLTASLEEIRANALEVESSLADFDAEAREEGRFIQRGNWVVDFMRHVITFEGELVELTPTEFDLLVYMISESPRVISPPELVSEAQGYECEPWEAGDIVRYHIHNIRGKIEKATGRTNIVRNVRGVGYTVGDEDR